MPDINLLQGTTQPKEKVNPLPRVDQTMIINKAVKPRHLEAGLFGVHIGVEANLPEEGTIYPVYFCQDSGKLKIWNGITYLSTTLS